LREEEDCFYCGESVPTDPASFEEHWLACPERRALAPVVSDG